MPATVERLIATLPFGLAERSRPLQTAGSNCAGQFVLYWMRCALRVSENPALDVAIATANRLNLPVFVYHSLSERHPFASDRHHTFIMQGARDVQTAIEGRRVAYGFHLERPGHRGPHLTTMADRAALVVTEDMPVEPLRSSTRALGSRVSTPIVAVDTACVVPMQLVGKAFDRAFAFRKATTELYDERLSRPPFGIEPQVAPRLPRDLPFEPMDLSNADIAELVSQCDIDHTIGPVPHTVGGSTAGYERWRAFKKSGLADYPRRRNNALVDGVSRMSPYLHFGMMSPLRIAREAAEVGNKGAEKFLDELLVWRELAYAFCFFRQDHDRISALPEWAMATLAEHEANARPANPSWETLARGRTGDALWDAAQRSLLLHGELHNNVRMTWGKQILNWTPRAEAALATMIDLNHRYALDGRDPASYGGILWCLGQFDRPHPPARPILGTVRNRSTEEHAQRLDPAAYLRKTTRPLREPMPKVAVIGAGISGLMCARTLADHGFPVTVFEKSRGAGGRMATRRRDGGLRFDHGAQYFTVRDNRFQRYVKSWLHDGVVGPWHGRIVALERGVIKEEKSNVDRFVAVPAMNAICKHLAADIDVRFQTRVSPLERIQEQWHLLGDDGTDLGKFDVAIVSSPAPQSAELLRAVPLIADRASGTKMRGCWAIMLAFPDPLKMNYDGAFVHDSPLAWIARNSNKPDREAEPETWILHASSDWAENHIEDSPERVTPLLIDEFWKATGSPPAQIGYSTAHRWRFALPEKPLADSCLFDHEMQIGACGDWCAGPRVEGAFLSGMAAAGRVLGLLTDWPVSEGSVMEEQRELF